jgi:hypothetical protein
VVDRPGIDAFDRRPPPRSTAQRGRSRRERADDRWRPVERDKRCQGPRGNRPGAVTDQHPGHVGLAEISNPEDRELFLRMLSSASVAVRAAGLRGLARIDRAAGRAAALSALDQGARGRVSVAAAAILRDGTSSHYEIDVLSRIALDPAADTHTRWRCTALLRPARWCHLGVLLKWRSTTTDHQLTDRIDQEIKTWVHYNRQNSKAPEPELRAAIIAGLPKINAQLRKEIEFALRTSS